MKLAEEDVSHHLSTSRIRLLLVQLNSPFGPDKELDLFPVGPDKELELFTAFGQFQWLDRTQSIEVRRRKVSSVLEFLRSSPSFSPDILVFPEYAIPRECHKMLVDFAVQQRCIVVAGSYYETERGQQLYRSNISKTFLPDGSELVIVKRHGYLRERDALDVSPDEPNVLRLKWSYAAGKTLSASIFICRDYLIPYEVDENGRRSSILDWERSGLNLVVMCSGEMRPFHSSATLDVHHLRGGRKFVALCNCAGVGAGGTGGGSALLGPTIPERREHDDVIIQMPATSEGMIYAEIDLENGAVVETKPGKQVHDPLIKLASSVFAWQDDFSRLNPKPLTSASSLVFRHKERGVWHAPFLSVIKRNLVLKLVVAQDPVDARKLLKGQQVRWITAVSLRGPHDFLITFYAPSGREDANTRVPYCTVNEDQLKELFESDSERTFVVTPEQMYKFRGVVVVEPHSEEWARQEEAIRELLDSTPSRRKALVTRICKLARDWNTSEVSLAERQEVSRVFSAQRETMPVIDSSDDPIVSQAFVLISINRPRDVDWEFFERDIVRGWLCNITEVRSIYKISSLGKRGEWDYWLDIAAKGTKIDQIVDEIQDRAKARKTNVATRTMTVRYYLKWDSVEGIERSEQLATVLNFMLDGSARLVWANGRSVLDVDRLWRNQSIANTIASGYFYQKDVIGWPEAGVGRDRFVRAFAHLLWGNFAEEERVREAERREAKNTFRAIYETAEEISQKIVEAELLGPYKEVIERWAKERGRAPDRIRAVLENAVLGLIEYLPSLKLEGFPAVQALDELRSDFNPRVIPVRNLLSHANGHNEGLDFSALGDEEGLGKAQVVIQALHTLSKALDVLVKLREWLNAHPETV